MRRHVVLGRKIPWRRRREPAHALDFYEMKYEVWDGIPVCIECQRGKLADITPLGPPTTGRTSCVS